MLSGGISKRSNLGKLKVGAWTEIIIFSSTKEVKLKGQCQEIFNFFFI